MKDFYHKSRHLFRLVCLIAGLGLFACGENEKNEGAAYRPDQPIELESFYPKSGPIATQVIIKGKNFGTQADQINVYFNEKKAAVISSTGERMLVLAPKLPGEECVISVSIGDNKAQFEETFDYIVQTTVSTLVGGTQGASMPQGTQSLSSTQFADISETGLAIDGDDNIFAVFKNKEDGQYRVYMMNEEAGNIKSIADFDVLVTSILISYDYISGNVYWAHANVGYNEYGYFDSRSDFVQVSESDVTYDKPLGYTDGMTSWGGRQSFVMNPEDGKFYFYTNEGTHARFDPATGKGENLTSNIFKDAAGDVRGLVFDPRDRNICYFAVKGQHCIYKHDRTAGTCTLWAGRKNTAGYLDGALDEAQFNEPCQMCADDEFIYVADSKNHCIRKITLATGYVSTLAGTAKTPGYANGPAENSTFNTPIGIAINSEGILFVNDSQNYAIRRIATE